MLEHFGIRDVFAELPDVPSVWLVSSDPRVIDYYRIFMREHHGREVRVTPVLDTGDCRVYKVEPGPATMD
jgi:hypothetical protein